MHTHVTTLPIPIGKVKTIDVKNINLQIKNIKNHVFFTFIKNILKDMHKKTSNYHIHSSKNMSSVSVTQLHWRHGRLFE